MERFNAVTSAVFDVLLAPLGEERAWFDLESGRCCARPSNGGEDRTSNALHED
jgi:hypothetical protein